MIMWDLWCTRWLWDRISYSILVCLVIFNPWVLCTHISLICHLYYTFLAHDIFIKMKRKINPWFPVLIQQVHIHFHQYNKLLNSLNNNHRSFTLPSKIKILRMNFMICIILHCMAAVLYLFISLHAAVCGSGSRPHLFPLDFHSHFSLSFIG